MAGHGSPPPPDRAEHPARKVHHVNPGVSQAEHDAYAAARYRQLYGSKAMFQPTTQPKRRPEKFLED